MDRFFLALTVAVLVVTGLLLARMDRSVRSAPDQLRSRLLFGIPWGTVIGITLVLIVYFFVQSGLEDRFNPVVIPFQSWSYTYPTGWLTAGFAHSGFSHMYSNVTATIVLGFIAEYAFSHYPQRRGSVSFASWRTNPYVRAFVIMPIAIVAIGLFTALFSIGPVIGFSGVVFAFAGFAVIRYPLTTVLGLFGLFALRRIYNAISDPTITRGFIETGPAPPWWAEIAIQGHAIGFILGALLGIYLFRRRGTLPAPWRIFAGVFFFAMDRGLWAVYWFEGTDQWVLLQGLGILLVIALAVLVTFAAVGSDRPIRFDLSARQVAVAVVALSLAFMIGPAVAVNLVTTDIGEADERPGIEVDDYRVIYAENIVNRMVAVGDIDIGGLGEVRTSGVIVYSEDRDLWTRAVSAQRLADRGSATVVLGDIASRVEVSATRPAWSVLGNASVYQVWLEGPDERVLGFESDRSTADVRISNHTVTIASVDGTFQAIVKHDNETIDTVPLPRDGETVTVGDLTLEHDDRVLYAQMDGTEVRIATRSQ